MPPRRINVVNKGKAAERDICDRLNNVLCDGKLVFRRTFHATEDLMHDISNPFGWAIEVKHQKNSMIPTWWRQACQQTSEQYPVPILFFRLPKRDWCVIVGSPFHSGFEIPPKSTLLEFYKWALEEMKR